MASTNRRSVQVDVVALVALVVGLSSSVAGVIGGYRTAGRWAPEIGLPLAFVLIFGAALVGELSDLLRRRRDPSR